MIRSIVHCAFVLALPAALLPTLLPVAAAAQSVAQSAADSPVESPAARTGVAASRVAAATATVAIEHGELLLAIGPVDLPAKQGAGEPDGAPIVAPLWVLVPRTGWLRGYHVDLVDEAGNPVPQSLLVRVNVITTQRRELFSGIMLRVAAAGPETGGVRLPSVIGYEAREGDTLLVRTTLRRGNRAYRGVRVRVHFPFTAASALLGAFTISPMYMDVTPPAGGHAFDLPPGHSSWHWEASPAIAGRILGLSGHVERYATLFRFEDRTANRVIWETKPDTAADGTPRQIPIKTFLLTLGRAIRPDHVYRLTVDYDNPTGAVIKDGGMGTLGGVFRPSGGVPWPAIDPNDEDYKLDVWAMWRP
jgi:hypothetical protein